MNDTPEAPPVDAPIPLPPPETPPEPSRRTWLGFDLVLGFLVLLLAGFLSTFAVTNSDLWMHLATGRMIAEGTYQFGVDPFAYTTEGVTWVNHAWLTDLIFYQLYESFGPHGLLALRLVLVLVLVVVLLANRKRGDEVWIWFACLALGLLTLSPRLLLQPALFSFVFLALTYWILTRTKGSEPGSRSGHLWLLPVVFAVWVNLDNWFILGPLTVALYLVGTLLGQMKGSPTTITPGKLALVLLVGTLACLLNPHHVQAFVLPPELAYLVVTLGDLFGDPFGNAGFVAGGRALQELNAFGGVNLISPLSGTYWRSPAFGQSVAGLAYVPLLLGGAVSFVLLLRAGKLPWPRLIVWFGFGLLSLLQSRFIPFFAIVAVPITARNLQDWLASLEPSPALNRTLEGWALGGRLAAGLVLILLGFMAWPGWLHSRFGDPTAARRVAWTLEPDPLLKQTALKLGELHKDGQLGHGLNISPDLANYCAWFAPKAKGFLDNRYNLFPGVASQLMKARQGLQQETANWFLGNKPDPKLTAAWKEVFQTHGVDHLILTNLQNDPKMNLVAQRSGLDGHRWVPLYEDGRNAVIGWKEAPGAERWASLHADRDRQAFGPVPENERAPAAGSDPPRGDAGWWQHYLEGQPPTPAGVALSKVHLDHFHLQSQTWLGPRTPFMLAWRAAQWFAVVGAAPVIPVTVSEANAGFSMFFFPDRLFAQPYPDSGRPFLRAKQPSSPAAALLAVRAARQAVAEQPENFQVQANLLQALNNLWLNQEDFWANYRGDQPATGLRHQLRRLQILTTLKNALTLDPNNANLNWQLGQMYLELQLLDVALDHLTQAVQNLHRVKVDPENSQQMNQRLQQWSATVHNLEAEIKRRKDYFDLHAGSLQPLPRFRKAVREMYVTEVAGKKQIDKGGLGLAKEALTALRDINFRTLKDQQEMFEVVYWNLRLLLQLGRLEELADTLPTLEKSLGPDYHEFLAQYAAARGDYTTLDKALAEMEKARAEENDRVKEGNQKGKWALIGYSLMKHGPGLPSVVLPTFSLRMLEDTNRRLDSLPATVAEVHLLRGLFALEQGDTAKARQLIEEALQMAGDVRFPDRVIGERYLESLKKY